MAVRFVQVALGVVPPSYRLASEASEFLTEAMCQTSHMAPALFTILSWALVGYGNT